MNTEYARPAEAGPGNSVPAPPPLSALDAPPSLDQAVLQRQQAADWAARLARFREQEWEAAQKLIAAAQCFLETFDEEALHKMTLAQVSRALKASSALARSALAGAELPDPSVPSLSPAQQQLLDALKRLYGQSRTSPVAPENPPHD